MSAEQVEGNEGLLIAILVWLPPISVFKFRCVSKRWKHIIADRFFLQSYHANLRNRQLYYGGGRMLALIQERQCYRQSCSHSLMKILPVAEMNEVRIKKIPRKLGDFVSSSNGLILCKEDGKTSFHVVNPLTRTWVKVPSCNLRSNSRFGFACEENMHEFVPSFRIVGVNDSKKDLEDNTVLIETYSSKTVYNPSEDENHLQLMELPQEDVLYPTLSGSSNDDVLWVVGIMDLEILKFWKLPKDEHGSYKRTTTIDRNEWILMHTIDTWSLCNDAATLFLGNEKRKKRNGGAVDDNVSYLSVEALTPWNPMVVILTHNLRVFRYNSESKKMELILYRGVPLDQESSLRMHPFVESLSLSSYALSGNTYG